jgi:uroporphyrinogen-III synthase
MTCNLHGIGVLVTRPSGQAGALCELITQHEGRPIHFPTISIGSSEDQDKAKRKLQSIGDYQIVIFISPNAVKYGLDFMEKKGFSSAVKICAVGKGTAQTLSDRGVEVNVSPSGPFDSESLLAMQELTDVEGLRILIVRGNGGRRLLGDELRRRGADVEYVEVYKREIAQANPEPLIAGWENDVDIVTATSCGILENLFSLFGEAGREKICKTPLVVVSERVKALAQELGCNRIIVANEASDQGLLSAICEWAAVTSR